MEEYNQRIKNLVQKNRKKLKKASQKNAPLRPRKRKGPIDRSPIDENKLTIRELRATDRQVVHKIASDYHRDFYISIYKRSFRSWFTYALTGLMLAMSVYFLNSTIYGLCLPPIVMTVFLLWRVGKYKRTNWCLNINEMEMLNQTESKLFKHKSVEARRRNQGVLVALLSEDSAKDKLKRKFMSKDFDLMNLNKAELDEVSYSDDEADLSSTSSDNDKDEEAENMKNRQIVGYLIYTKHKDELETVSIRDICVDRDYRKRGVAKYFIKKACLNVFKNNGCARVTFNVSNFHSEASQACEKKSSYVHKIYSWTAFFFILGVCDVRNTYSFNIDQVNKMCL
jgi:hypothetical protein